MWKRAPATSAILPTLSSISAPFEVQNRALATVFHILPTLSLKSAPNVTVFKLSLQSSFLSTFLQIEPPNRRNRDSPPATPNSNFTPKNKGFRAREYIMFSPMNSCGPDTVHFPTTWWCAEMVMRLAWWWKCWPWRSSVLGNFLYPWLKGALSRISNEQIERKRERDNIYIIYIN